MTQHTRASITLGSQLAAADNRPAGFDYLRIILALTVIALHAYPVTYGPAGSHAMWTSAWGPFARMVVPAFFALSGFLVAGSFERSVTMVRFFGLRIIRIFPALVVETVLSAVILGPLVTEYALSRYFTDPLLARYALNMLGEPQYYLPGVFVSNPEAIVNGQLWTIPWELACYVSMAAIGVLGARKRHIIAPLAALAVTLIYVGARIYQGQDFPALDRALPGPLLVVSFLLGVSLYLYRDRVPTGLGWGLATIALSLLLLSIEGAWQYLAPLPVAYVTVWLGTLDPRRIAIIAGADYSYGVFLYGYPMEQTVVWAFPQAQSPWLTALGGMALAIAVAAFSWHWVEKPALRMKDPLARLEKRWLALKAARTAR